MGYGLLGSMGYGFDFPAYQLGGSKNVWVMGEYGLSGLWVMRESTVTVEIPQGYPCQSLLRLDRD